MQLLEETEQLFRGATFERVSRGEHSWSFWFSIGSLEVTHLWRLLEGGVLVATDRDDGRSYGEPAAVDAEALARGLLAGRRVLAAMIHPETADLGITLEGGVRLEVLAVSSRTEAWHLSRRDEGFTIAATGGRLSEPGRFFTQTANSTPA